jgi:cytochrome b subunit of formate dehydrogenase
LSEKFGLKATQVAAFEDSFHGLASRSGDATVANCASCHGVHDILPSSDERSHIHPSNLAATCGTCHPGAGATFAIGAVHVLPADPESAHPAVYWIRAVYLWLIVLTIGGMLLHNGLDFWRKARLPALRALAAPSGAPERMSRVFRLTHGLLAASFLVLVYSGFALTYPEAWWSRPLAAAGGADLRGTIHRVAAVVMLAAALLHVVHLARSRGARACAKALALPTRHDWHELKERVAFLFGRRRELPESPWVGYPEKMEYLAVLWGTFVMTATGFLLWFENLALRWAPKWVTDAATVIHFWEAVLAALAILVWHFYLVIFDPLVYPIDPAFWTGRSAGGRAHERRNAQPPRA